MGVFQIMANEEYSESFSEEESEYSLDHSESSEELKEPEHKDGESFTVFFSVLRHGTLKYLSDRFTFGPKQEGILINVTQKEGLVCFQHYHNLKYLNYTDQFEWSDNPCLFTITFGGHPDNPVTCRHHQTKQALTCRDGQLVWTNTQGATGGMRLEFDTAPRSFLQQSKEFIGRQRNGIILMVLIGLLILAFLIQAH